MEVQTGLVIPEQTQKLMAEAVDYLGSITEIVVKNQGQYDNAVGLCKQIKSYSKKLDEERDGMVRPLNQQVKEVNATFKAITEKLDNGEKRIKSAMGIYFQEQERQRIEAQRKLEAEAEAKRRAAEEKAAEERRKAEEYAAQGRQEMADKAASRAEAQEDRAVNTVAQVIEAPKTEGVAFRTKYTARITDARKVVEYCMVTNPQCVHMIIIDLKVAEKMIEGTKGAMRIPGIEYTETRIPIVRT